MPRRDYPKRRAGESSAADYVDVSDPAVLRIDLVTGPERAGGWVHTHGLEAFGLPELEIRGVAQRFLMPVAAMILSDIADYMVNGGQLIDAGDAVVIADLTYGRLVEAEPLPGHDDHYGAERLTLVDLPEAQTPWLVGSDGPGEGEPGPCGPGDPELN